MKSPLRLLIGRTATEYPFPVHAAHSLWAAHSFRAAQEAARGHQGSWLHSLVASYFCYGFGGTTVCDVFLGGAPALLSSADIPLYYFVAWALVNYCPGDAVYAAMRPARSPLRLALRSLEAIDSFTTLTGRVQKAQRLFPAAAHGLAPFVAGNIAANGGALFRALEARGRGATQGGAARTPWAAPSSGFRRGLAYCAAFCLWQRLALARGGRGRGAGSGAALAAAAEAPRFWLCLVHILWEAAAEFKGEALGDLTAAPAAALHGALTALGAALGVHGVGGGGVGGGEGEGRRLGRD